MIPQSEMTEFEHTASEIVNLLQTQYSRVLAALETGDVGHLRDVKATEEEINALHARIESLVIRFIALYQPVAKELRATIMTLRTSIDMERIGDYMVSMARVLRKFQHLLPVEIVEAVRRLFVAAGEMALEVCRAALAEDAVRAVEIWKRDRQVNDVYHGFTAIMESCANRHDIDAEVCRKLYLLAKNCERMGDHATNIAEHTYYQVYGSPLDLEEHAPEEA